MKTLQLGPKLLRRKKMNDQNLRSLFWLMQYRQQLPPVWEGYKKEKITQKNLPAAMFSVVFRRVGILEPLREETMELLKRLVVNSDSDSHLLLDTLWQVYKECEKEKQS